MELRGDNVSLRRNNQIKLTHYDETKKMAPSASWVSGGNHFASNTINVSILHLIYLMEEDNISGESCFKYKGGNTWLHEIVMFESKNAICFVLYYW